MIDEATAPSSFRFAAPAVLPAFAPAFSFFSSPFGGNSAGRGPGPHSATGIGGKQEKEANR